MGLQEAHDLNIPTFLLRETFSLWAPGGDVREEHPGGLDADISSLPSASAVENNWVQDRSLLSIGKVCILASIVLGEKDTFALAL